MRGEPLYGIEIENALHEVVDVISANHVTNLRGPVLLVCNTSTSDRPGEHWVAICIDKHQRGEFFDSLGMPPIVYGLGECMKHAKQWMFNDVKIQGDFSSVCGYYVIGYLRSKMQGFTMSAYLSLFSNDYALNDDLIYNLINV